MIRALEWLGRRALFAFDPETAHGLSIAALKSGLPLVPAAEARRTAEMPSPASTSPIRSAWRPATTRTPRCPTRCSARLRLRRGRHGDAAAAGRQSEAAHLPADRRQAVINRLGFNNEGHERCLRALSARARAGRHRRRQHRRQQGQRRPHRRLRSRRAAVRRSRVLPHRQHLLAQHAGPADHAGARKRSPNCWPASWRRAPMRDRKRTARAAVPQDRAGPRGGRTCRHRRRSAGDKGRGRSSSPTRRSRGTVFASAAHIAAKQAACPAGRCSSARRPCWRGCGSLLGPEWRSSASAASIRRRRRSKRSAPAPISCSSTPA